MTRERPRCCRSIRSGAKLVDGERALHPGSPVAVDGAEERVRPASRSIVALVDESVISSVPPAPFPSI